MLLCRDGSLYTGAAKDLESRVARHQAGRAARYTRARLPVTLAWSCGVSSWSRALRLEWRVKRLTREEKRLLISGERPLPRSRP
jgi:putative endonuclease